MKPIDLYIDADLVKEAQELSNPLLKVPEDAAIGKGDTRRWAERLTVAETSVEVDENDETRYVFRVRFKVSALSPCKLNHGRSISLWARYAPKPANDKEAFMTKLTINRLDSLLRAVGYQFEPGERVNYGRLFSESEGNAIVGSDVMATVSDRPDNKDATVRRQEPSNFVAVE